MRSFSKRLGVGLSHTGFSLIELMVVVAIVAVLAVIAGPNFVDSIKRYRVNATRDELIASIQWARSEAIRRGFPVLLVRTVGCGVVLANTDDWSCGWQAVVDTNQNAIADAAEPVVQVTSVPVGYSVTHPNLGISVSLNRWGQAQLTPENFIVSPAGGGVQTSTVCIYAGGQAKKLVGAVAC